MKKVMVIAVLFLSTSGFLSSQTFASVDNPYAEPEESSVVSDDKSKSPEKTDSPIFITGSDYQSELTGLRLLPTPAKEKVELLINSKFDKVYQVELFDVLGNKLSNYEVASNDPKSINVDQHAAGSYYFLIYIPDGSIKKKFKIVD